MTKGETSVKLVKNLGTYCMIMIFVMTLTSSFLVSSEDVSKIGDVSLKEEKMKKVFYSSSSKMDGNTQVAKKEEKKEKEDSQPSTSTSGEVAYEGLYENKPSVNEAGYTLGDSSEEILAYQKLLYYLDYLQALPEGQYKGIPGGNFEKTTETAVKEYQTKEKLQATGTLDKETQGSLISKPIEFKVGKSGDEIQSYQLILYYLDYIKEYPKGNFDNLTETAVKSYQEDRKLDDTGILTQETQKSLKSEALEYLAGKRGKAIMEYQDVLISLGYLQGNPDGQLGSISVDAIKIYQEKNDLEITGYLDTKTLKSMKKPLDQQVKFK